MCRTRNFKSELVQLVTFCEFHARATDLKWENVVFESFLRCWYTSHFEKPITAAMREGATSTKLALISFSELFFPLNFSPVDIDRTHANRDAFKISRILCITRQQIYLPSAGAGELVFTQVGNEFHRFWFFYVFLTAQSLVFRSWSVHLTSNSLLIFKRRFSFVESFVRTDSFQAKLPAFYSNFKMYLRKGLRFTQPGDH